MLKWVRILLVAGLFLSGAILAMAAAFGESRYEPGGFIVFVKGGDIWKYEVKKESETRLTHDGTCENPRVSPDGKSVIYTSRRDHYRVKKSHGTVECSQIYVLDIASRKSEILLQQPQYRFEFPSYSDDGRLIIYRRSSTDQDLIELQVFERGTVKVIPIAQGQSYGEESPFCYPDFIEKGAKISVMDYGPGLAVPCVLSAGGGEKEEVRFKENAFPEQMCVSFISYLHGSSRAALAFTTYGGSLDYLYCIYDFKSGRVQKIPVKGSKSGICRFSPDGRFVVCESCSDAPDRTRILIAPIEGGPARQIAAGNSPDWGR
ncbi:MAG: TolB family protein [Candidatus Xenobiia bacterium LiM19]